MCSSPPTTCLSQAKLYYTATHFLRPGSLEAEPGRGMDVLTVLGAGSPDLAPRPGELCGVFLDGDPCVIPRPGDPCEGFFGGVPGLRAGDRAGEPCRTPLYPKVPVNKTSGTLYVCELLPSKQKHTILITYVLSHFL